MQHNVAEVVPSIAKKKLNFKFGLKLICSKQNVISTYRYLTISRMAFENATEIEANKNNLDRIDLIRWLVLLFCHKLRNIRGRACSVHSRVSLLPRETTVFYDKLPVVYNEPCM
jgi:hypothetical protein